MVILGDSEQGLSEQPDHYDTSLYGEVILALTVEEM